MEKLDLKVEILLREYDTLRQEVMSRYAAQFQGIGTLGVVIVGLVAAVAAHFDRDTCIWLMVGAFAVFIALFMWADADISRIAKRLRELERDINKRAGETLLVWETNRVWHGGGGLMNIITRTLQGRGR